MHPGGEPRSTRAAYFPRYISLPGDEFHCERLKSWFLNIYPPTRNWRPILPVVTSVTLDSPLVTPSGCEVLLKPSASKAYHFLKSTRLFEEMTCTRYAVQVSFRANSFKRVSIEYHYGTVISANNKERRAPSLCQCLPSPNQAFLPVRQRLRLRPAVLQRQ